VVAAVEPAGGPEPVRAVSPRRGRFDAVDGQLPLWDPDRPELAPVHPLFPADRLETAA
jgi:hypothetical protein